MSFSSTVRLSPFRGIVIIFGTATKKESICSPLIIHGFGCGNNDHVELLKKYIQDIALDLEDAFHEFALISFWKYY